MGSVGALDGSILSLCCHMIEKGTLFIHQALQCLTFVVDPAAALCSY